MPVVAAQSSTGPAAHAVTEAKTLVVTEAKTLAVTEAKELPKARVLSTRTAPCPPPVPTAARPPQVSVSAHHAKGVPVSGPPPVRSPRPRGTAAVRSPSPSQPKDAARHSVELPVPNAVRALQVHGLASQAKSPDVSPPTGTVPVATKEQQQQLLRRPPPATTTVPMEEQRSRALPARCERRTAPAVSSTAVANSAHPPTPAAVPAVTASRDCIAPAVWARPPRREVSPARVRPRVETRQSPQNSRTVANRSSLGSADGPIDAALQTRVQQCNRCSPAVDPPSQPLTLCSASTATDATLQPLHRRSPLRPRVQAMPRQPLLEAAPRTIQPRQVIAAQHGSGMVSQSTRREEDIVGATSPKAHPRRPLPDSMRSVASVSPSARLVGAWQPLPDSNHSLGAVSSTENRRASSPANTAECSQRLPRSRRSVTFASVEDRASSPPANFIDSSWPLARRRGSVASVSPVQNRSRSPPESSQPPCLPVQNRSMSPPESSQPPCVAVQSRSRSPPESSQPPCLAVQNRSMSPPESSQPPCLAEFSRPLPDCRIVRSGFVRTGPRIQRRSTQLGESQRTHQGSVCAGSAARDEFESKGPGGISSQPLTTDDMELARSFFIPASSLASLNEMEEELPGFPSQGFVLPPIPSIPAMADVLSVSAGGTVSSSDDGSSYMCAFADVYGFGVAVLSEFGIDDEIRSDPAEGDVQFHRPLPGPPMNFTCAVLPAEDGTVCFEMAWVPPANADEAAISHYVVEVCPDDTDQGSEIAFRATPPHPHTAIRLAAVPRGRQYSVTLVSVGSAGNGPRSIARIIVPAERSEEAGQAMHLRWIRPERSVVGFRIFARAGTDNAEWETVLENTHNDEGSVTLWAPSGIWTEFRAAGIEHNGIVESLELAARVEVTTARLPRMVQSLHAVETAINDSDAVAVHVSWRAPEESADILHYRLTASSGGTGLASRQTLFATRIDAPGTQTILSGFMRGSDYYIAVAPVSEHGEGVEVVLPFSPLVDVQTIVANDEVSFDSSLSEAQRIFKKKMRQRWDDPSAVGLSLRLRRASVFEESVAILGSENAAKDFLQERLYVEFDGEIGVDGGGLLREWVFLVIQEGCRKERGFFEDLDESGYVWPSVVAWHVDPQEAAIVFRMIGRVLGVSLLAGHCPGFRIHPIFWQWAFPSASTNREEINYFLALQHFDRTQFLQRARLVYTRAQLAVALGTSEDTLAALLPEWQPLDESEVDALELTWDYDVSVCGVRTTSELTQITESSTCSGSDVGEKTSMVSKAEAAEYLSLWSRQRIVGLVEAQLKALRGGIVEVVAESELAVLSPSELEEFILGVGWNVDELLPHVDIVVVREGTVDNSSAALFLQWLEQVLREFTDEQREAFLHYVTGAARLPVGGAAALQPKFMIQVIPSWSTDSLPVAHTCANLLDMPFYGDMETLRKRLLTALRFGNDGFGIM